MQAGPTDRKTSSRFSRFYLNRKRCKHGIPRQTAGLQKLLITACKNNLSALLPCTGPYVDDIVSNRNYILIMLHHQYCIALITELFQQTVHAADVPWVHSRAGFVEDIRHSGQATPHVPD